MKLAIVGSREGADLDHLKSFLGQLERDHPDTIVVSGGAIGVDQTVETWWASRGGTVISFRPKSFPNDEFGVERWDLGLLNHSCTTDLVNDLVYEDYQSAINAKDLYIAFECDRLVSFVRKGGSRGARRTANVAEQNGKPVFEFEAS